MTAGRCRSCRRRGPMRSGPVPARWRATEHFPSVGLAAISCSDAFQAPRKTRRCRATAPQTHGRPGSRAPARGRLGEGLLRQTVLTRVVADRRRTRPRRRGERERHGQCGAQLNQLVVDLNPQSLEHPAGRVALAADRGRDRGSDHVHELSGRRGGPGPHDRARAKRPDNRPSPFSRNSAARASSGRPLTRSAAVTPAVGSIRMSSGPSVRDGKPERSERSSCGELTPRSSRTPDRDAEPCRGDDLLQRRERGTGST